MKKTQSVLRHIFCCVLAAALLLGLTAVFAESVPEGYPPVREGIDFGGTDVYIYTWWSGDYWDEYGTGDHTAREEAQHAYRLWLQDTYNVHVHTGTRGDWGSIADEMIDFAGKGGEAGKLAIFTQRSDEVLRIIEAGAAAPIGYDMSGSKWNQGDIEAATIRNTVYGTQTGNSEPRQCLFFNKRILEQAGIDWNGLYDAQENGTWTWEMFEQVLAQVQASGAAAGITGSRDDLLQIAVYSGGGSFIDADENGNLYPAVDSDATRQALSWAVSLWDTYSLPRPDDGGWNWYQEAWANGETAFYVAQAYTGFNSGFSGLADAWGCLMFPKGGTGSYVNLPNDNLVMIPSCYDSQTVDKLMFIYEMWVMDAPGYDDDDSWAESLLALTDERAVYETYGTLRAPETQVANRINLFGGANTLMGQDLLWVINSGNVDDVTANCAELWAARCNSINQAYGWIAVPYSGRTFAVGAAIDYAIGGFDRKTDQYVHLLLEGEDGSLSAAATVRAWDASAGTAVTVIGAGATETAGHYYLTLGPDPEYAGIEKKMVAFTEVTVLEEGLAKPVFSNIQTGETVGTDVSGTVRLEGTQTGYMEIGRIDSGSFVTCGWFNLYDFDGTGEIDFSLLGLNLDEAGAYEIRAVALTHEPFEEPSGDIADSEMAVYGFTLTGEMADCPEVTLAQSSANYGDLPLEVSFTVAGADAVAWRYTAYNLVTDEEEVSTGIPASFTDGDTGTVSFSESAGCRPGRYEIFFWARFGDVWSRMSEPVDFYLYSLPVLKDEAGNVLEDGDALSGRFYYKIYAEIPEGYSGLFFGWTENMEAAEPDYWEDEARWLSQDEGGAYIIIMPEIYGEYTQENMFVRLAPGCPAQRIALYYDRDTTDETTTVITSGAAELFTPYTLQWEAVEGAALCLVEWTTPDGNTWVIPVDGAQNEYMFPGEFAMEDILSRPGQYRATVTPFVNGRRGTASEPLEFTAGLPDNAGELVFLSVDREEQGGIVDVQLYEGLRFTISSAESVRNNVEDIQFFQGDWMERANPFELWQYGRTDVWWTPGREIAPYCDYIVYARMLIYDRENNREEWFCSNPLTIRVHMEETIAEDITYTVSGTQPVQVAKDGALTVQVNNIGADYYGCYIEENDTWIADSRWVFAEDGETTEVRMPVFGCEPGNTYQAHVYAVKFGAPQKTADTVIDVEVTARETDTPIIIAMKDQFRTGERIRIYASYENPDQLNEEQCWIQVRVYPEDDPGYWIMDRSGEGFYFWTDNLWVNRSGNYIAEAVIMEANEDWSEAWELDDTRTFFSIRVDSDGVVADPQAEQVSLLTAGEDLVFSVSTTAEENRPAADGFSVNVDRIDGEWIFVDYEEFEAENGAAEIRIDKGFFEAGGIYNVSIYANKTGYDSAETNFRFVVTEAAGEELVLTLNGSAEAEQEILSSTNVKVRVAYGDSRPTAVRILNGFQWEYWWGAEDDFRRDWGFGDDEILMYAEATWDDTDFEALNNSGWADFDWNRDVNWSARSNMILLRVTSPNGAMKPPAFTIENSDIAWGEDLIVRIEDAGPMDTEGNAVPGGWFFCNIYQQRDDGNGGFWWDSVGLNVDYQLSSGENHIPTYNLEENGIYQFTLGADAEGYSGSGDSKNFTVGAKPEQTESRFTINGQTGNLTAQTNENLVLILYSPEAAGYTVEITTADGEGWWDQRGDFQDGMFYGNWQSGTEGVFTMSAYAYHGGNEGEEPQRELLGTAVVTVTAPSGDLGDPQAALNKDIVHPGEMMQLHIDPAEGAKIYSYWIHRDDNDNWIAGTTGRSGDFRFSTDDLQGPGVYCVEVDIQGVGYNQGHTTLYFAELDENAFIYESDKGIFSIDTLNMETHSGAYIVAYMPDAEEIRLYAAEGGEARAEDEFDYRNRPGISTWFGRDNAGVFDLWYSGNVGGVWTDPVKACTVTITAPNGTLGTSQIIVNGVGEETAEVPYNGDNLSVTIPAVEHAENYYIEVKRGDGSSFYGAEYPADGDTLDFMVEIQEGTIEAGTVCEISCRPAAAGYESTVFSRIFLLQAETADQTLTLTVNGSDESVQEVLSSSNLHVEIAYGNDRPTAMRVLNGNQWEYWWGNDSYERDWGYGGGTVIIYAEASWDDIDFEGLENSGWENFDWTRDVNWTGRSNTIQLNVINPYGEMKEPEFTIENSSPAWGEDLVINVADAGPMDTEGNLIRDGWYYWNIEVQRVDVDGNSWWDGIPLNFDVQIGSGANRIPTYTLEENARYRIHLGADAEGYSGRGSWKEFSVGEKQAQAESRFTVNGSAENQTIQTFERLTLIAYRSGADWYSVEITKQDDEGWRDERSSTRDGVLYDNWQPNEEGVYLLTAYAFFAGAEDGEPLSEIVGTVTVTVTAPNGDLPAPAASLSKDVAYPGETLTLHFEQVGGATNYSYWIHPDYDGNDWITGEGRDDVRDFTFSTDDLRGPGVYRIELDIQGVGYNQGHASIQMAVLDRNDIDCSGDGFRFTIGTAEIETHGKTRIIAYKPGAEAVRLYSAKDGGEAEPFEWRDGQGISTEFSRDDAGTFDILCSWQTDGVWTEPVRTCTVTVAAPNGALGTSGIIVNGVGEESMVIPYAGGSLSVTIPAVEHAEDYFVSIWRRDDGWTLHSEGYRAEGDAVAFVVENQEGTIETGTVYEISCWAAATGYEGAGFSRIFLLQDENQEQTLTLTVNGSDEAVQEVLSSVSQYVKVAYESSRPTAMRVMNNNQWEYWWGEYENFERNWGFGDGTVLMYAEATWDDIDFEGLDNGGWEYFDWNRDVNWTGRSNAIQLNVISPNGEMREPEFAIADTQIARGENLVINVTDAGPMDTEGNVIGNGWYYYIFEVLRDDGSGNTWWERTGWDINVQILSGTNYIPTFTLEENCRYRIEIGADAEGYSGRSTKAEFTIEGVMSPYDCASKLTLPAGLKEIEEEAFAGIIAADAVIIPEGVTAIGGRAFADSSVKMIVLPSTVTLDGIAEDAFAGSELQIIFGSTGAAEQYAVEINVHYCTLGN